MLIFIIMPPSTDITEFHTYLSSANHIVALCSAGLSASSGLLWCRWDVKEPQCNESRRERSLTGVAGEKIGPVPYL